MTKPESTGSTLIFLHRILERHLSLASHEVYAAGPEPFLAALKEAALARGLPASSWHAELFV